MGSFVSKLVSRRCDVDQGRTELRLRGVADRSVRMAYLVAHPGHQTEWATAFGAGLKRHGWKTSIGIEPNESDLLVFWGIRRQEIIAEQKRRGGEVCILERGYLGDRFKWTSVSFGGGLNGRGEFRGISKDASRFERHFGHLMQPWRRQDGYALLIGQVAGDMSLKAVNGDLSRWYIETSNALRKAGHDVRFRPHPGTIKRGTPIHVPTGVKMTSGTLVDAIAGASIVVTYNSNTGVESVLAGAPTVAADVGSMAWPMTSHNVGDEPVTPDRSQWASDLAWKQWQLAEMESGECWDAVGQVYAEV